MLRMTGPNGLDIQLSQSRLKPEATCVVIFSQIQSDVQKVIDELADEWANVEFLIPHPCPSGWAAMGRVSGARIGSPSIVGG